MVCGGSGRRALIARMEGSSPRWLGAWWPALAWAGVIFFGSTDAFSARRTSRFIGPFLRWLFPNIQDTAIASVQLVVRKGWHVTEYAILALLVARALRAQSPTLAAPRRAALGFLLVVAYAISDEIHQSFHPSRQGSPWDVMIDSAGALLGLGLAHLYLRRNAASAASRRQSTSS